MKAKDVHKSINMPPPMWEAIAARLNSYAPPLSFVDWARRVFHKELSQPADTLIDLAEPAEPPNVNRELRREI